MIGSRAITRSGVWMRAARAALGHQRHHGAQHRGAGGRAAAPGTACSRPRRSARRRPGSPGPRPARCRCARTGPMTDQCPSSVRKAPYSALVTGNAMNSSSSTEQPTTAEAMNRSPLKKPRRATPNAAIITSASRATKAPMPMPNWLTASVAQCAVEALERPAFGADHEATDHQPGKTQQAARQQPAAPAPCRAAPSDPRPPAPARPARRAARCARSARACTRPLAVSVPCQDLRQHAVPGGVLDGVPGQDQVGQQARQQPEANGLVRVLRHSARPVLNAAGNSLLFPTSRSGAGARPMAPYLA